VRPLDVFPGGVVDLAMQSILDGRPASAPVVNKAEDVGQAKFEKGVDDCRSASWHTAAFVDCGGPLLSTAEYPSLARCYEGLCV
jgi:hypothetical protein